MKQKKYKLGFDISTSSIGVCLFENLGGEGKLIELTHFEPKDKENTKLESLITKANACVEKMVDNYSYLNIERVIVEAPLFNSINQKTALTLALFNEYLTTKISEAFKIEIDFITIHDSRKYGLPELLGKNGKMMSDFPKEIAGLSKSSWSKYLIMYLISQRYKNVSWLMNNALKINIKNFDRADSIVVALGFMIKSGEWSIMGDINYWKDADLSYDRCVEIIEKNVAYEKFCKLYIDKNKTLDSTEKKRVKIKYLKEDFKIKDYINVTY